jgi:hypothetical protein
MDLYPAGGGDLYNIRMMKFNFVEAIYIPIASSSVFWKRPQSETTILWQLSEHLLQLQMPKILMVSSVISCCSAVSDTDYSILLSVLTVKVNTGVSMKA